jgi:transposase-like protein
MTFLMDMQFIPNELPCVECGRPFSLAKYSKNCELYAWRCYSTQCSSKKNYITLRRNSFFEGFSIPIPTILRVVLRYGTRTPAHVIKRQLNINEKTIDKILCKLRSLIRPPDFSNHKLGGPNKVVQIDETMINHSIKAHRGRSPSNKTDSLCIVECESGSIKRCFAKVIPNKQQSTIVPIILSQVAANSIIHTDEHRAYYNLRNYFSEHGTVCHKYSFKNPITGVHTQAIESFHNELKLEIKRRKGVLTVQREEFLWEFCFYFNNRDNFLFSVIDLIKCYFVYFK